MNESAREAQIPREKALLETETEITIKLIEELMERLKPVMRPPEPEALPCGQTSVADNASVPLANDLLVIKNKVKNSNYNLSKILERLEL